MPVDLPSLVAPEHTAVLTMEMQRGVVGDLGTLGALGDAVREQEVIPNTARLLGAARAAGARVVHCLAEFRPDLAGSAFNCPMLAVMRRRPGNMQIGTPAVELVPELGPEPSDIATGRMHGMAPFVGTELDSILRNLGVRTVVATGVSVNIGVLGMVIEAVDYGYQVVLPTDAVAGVPKDYADAVIANTLALLATVTTVDQIIDAWKGAA